MLGTIVNTAAILIGSAVGACLKKGIGEKHQNALYNAMGLAACGLGIHAIVQNMPNSHFPVMFIISLAAGSLIGSMLSLHEKFEKLTASFTKGNIGPGLSTAILLFCVGTLSILGPMESALHGDNTYLYTNATLDFVTSLVLASTYGIGIALSAVLLFLWQGGIYLFSGYLSSFSAELLTEISLVGGFLIFSSGLSILKIKDCKALNMLPSLFVPILWFLIKTVI
ncbi:MAG: DUF554 domain-containing protein [Paenibacillus macerans]|uniref:DUF554 family protein n=1 Tax=Paenibacillus macerans TaxID=44252 RepID=A0A090ZLQ0_PAEMA|nr:DUF554 domain-containing protein [Paenibacillus macerans]KFN12319.1 hypothetical protein DJ90_1969 [Paenibacillus macerans]MCY7558316.1 DUF554 domain-containing protein [Paenibacillus macerans]MDU7474623.1 DUF554 domain-containing protein [Paenibacillus macerans]MEC0150302.1 DUF554 domain-containing protein [Paenibacillus macerans]MEC0332739.1 DUF554 domain-containing protein [Paenibacillus macerans]